MRERGRLGDFLHARRSRLRPADVGLKDYGDRRRVAGLRREELAMLAGVSVSYYTRLEQGQSAGASAEILDAVARALLLDEAERRHLHDLAGAGRGRAPARRARPEQAKPATLDLLDTLEGVPALVSGRRTDVLAWNRLGHALFAAHVDPGSPRRAAERPNLARMVFLDPHTRELYADWTAKAKAVVENLRMVAGRFPDDTLLTSLIGELTVKSPEFAAMWTDHRVRPCALGRYEMRHPLVGTLTVTQQSVHLPQAEDQHLVMAVTEPGSPSREAVTLLAQATARPRSAVRPEAAREERPAARP
ncbi:MULTISPECIES: helix-turn-helix domain-containing protein [Actinomadura]|uniref:Helix-turn-helix domain-containing protein n=1 Tax=Actinomadura yumaensis TaxID=111807 RepID=A0ABW2CCA2_9ACTN|nr:helix-turn-helix transcriptional regulator [Actinomadura sp. J1-007]MWK38205.1 helix-turn-helix domain-containing protein [Actinomadura sp. J1-007]